jgi:hypothetical protein
MKRFWDILLGRNLPTILVVAGSVARLTVPGRLVD